MTANARRATILALLAVLMAVTRLHHFGAVPDASWAVFFAAGFHLRAWQRWAFPLLMLLAVAIDWLVIHSQGLSFWEHYCVSPAYWCLVPAHFVLWAGGSLLQRRLSARPLPALSQLALALLVSVALCHLIAQGSFYWVSDSVASPTLAGWWKNYSDWLPAYLRTSAMYVGLIAIAHVLAQRILATVVAARPAQAD